MARKHSFLLVLLGASVLFAQTVAMERSDARARASRSKACGAVALTFVGATATAAATGMALFGMLPSFGETTHDNSVTVVFGTTAVGTAALTAWCVYKCVRG